MVKYNILHKKIINDIHSSIADCVWDELVRFLNDDIYIVTWERRKKFVKESLVNHSLDIKNNINGKIYKYDLE